MLTLNHSLLDRAAYNSLGFAPAAGRSETQEKEVGARSLQSQKSAVPLRSRSN